MRNRLTSRLRSAIRHRRTDAYVVSFPKAGRTWLRVLMGKALCDRFDLPEGLLLDTYALTTRAGILRTRMTHDGSAIMEARSYRALASSKDEYARKAVVLMTRDLRDLLVSGYFQATTRVGRFTGSISDYIRDERFGAIKVVTFHRSWLENRDVPGRFLLTRYEDLHENPSLVLGEVLSFIGVERLDEELLSQAVDYSRFDKMKNMEQSGRFKSGMLRPRVAGNDESFKVRRGIVGGYRDYLSDEDVRYIEAVSRDLDWPAELESHSGPRPRN